MKTGLPIKSLHEHIVALAKKNPKKAALLNCDEKGVVTEEITYKELSEKIEAAAEYLHSLGLKKGDRVALAFKNSAELLILSWAAWSTGIVTVPMDTKRDTGELYQYKIKINDAKLLIAQRGALKNIEQTYLKDFKVVEFAGFPNNQGETLMWEKGLDHLALILFTSGTTGHPKGAKLSLKNLITNADGIRQWLHIEEKDRFLVNLPLHHINSTTFCLSTLLAGGSIAIPPNYSNSNFWQHVAQSGATITSIVQSILFDQLGHEDAYAAVRKDVKLNRIQIGSAPVIAHTVQEFRKKFGIAVYQGYGHTETALRVTGVPMGLPQTLYEQLVEQNSIGVPMPWADVQIADNEGRILGENEEGEIIVKGSAIMEGYIGGEPAFRDGYFLTGDIGLYRVIDGQRFFFIRGRKKEMIIKGGVNISPIAVENSLKKISADIEQVHIVAVPDERYGEEIGAVIAWKKGIDVEAAKRRLKITFLSGTPHVSPYETPKYIASLPIEELPTTSTGKVQRTILRDKMPYERFGSIYGLVKMPDVRFTVLHRYSRWVRASFDLYARCWSPIPFDRAAYEKDIPKQLIILAVDREDKMLGQIAVVRTSLSGDELLTTTYKDLLTSRVLDPQGTAFVCISICSAEYKARPVPDITTVPDEKAVREYLPNDPVYKFHQKPKGGQGEGAKLVGLIPEGRPEDKSSLGYNMLLKYPEIDVNPQSMVMITPNAPISSQLIEVVLLLAKDIAIKDVYAYSRPGGLASYMAKSKTL